MNYPWRAGLTKQERKERERAYWTQTLADRMAIIIAQGESEESASEAIVAIMMRAPSPFAISVMLERGFSESEQYSIDTDPAWQRAVSRFVNHFSV